MYNQAVITIGDSGIYLYGICMAVGIICCFLFLLYALQRMHSNEESINKLLSFGIVATAFGVFMAAVFQGLYNYIDDPSGGFSLSGLTFYGGLIGGVVGFVVIYNLYIYVIAPHCKSKLLSNHMNTAVSDGLSFVPIGIGIAHAFGRLGCTFAGCCHGAVTDAWYGVYMYATGVGWAKVVPTQTFECLFIVLLTIIMAVLYFKFNFQYNMGVYCIAYGVFRFFIEYLRDDYRGSFVGSLTPSQFWAIVMVVIGIAYFFVHKYFFTRFMKHPELQEVEEEGKKAEAKTDGRVSTYGIVRGCVIAVGVILAIVGVCVGYVKSGFAKYGLGDGFLKGYARYDGMAVMAYLTLGLAALSLVMFALTSLAGGSGGARSVLRSKGMKYAAMAVGIATMVSAVISLMLSNTLINTIDSSTGAWLVTLGGLFGGGFETYDAVKIKTPQTADETSRAVEMI